MKKFFIFDLDHTVIDSSHRQITKADGSLCLDSWRAMSTRKHIMADSLLPLADDCRRLIAEGHHVIACTARVMSHDDHDFLQRHGFWFTEVLSRPSTNSYPDHLLKEGLLRAYAFELGMSLYRFATMSVVFDDNKNVRDHLFSHGFTCYNAISINAAKVA